MAKKKITEEVIKKEAVQKAAPKKTESKKFDHEDLKNRLIDKLAGIRNVSLEDATDRDMYFALGSVVKDFVGIKWVNS